MRPGPGLVVVMALAFIFGARRGITQKTISPTKNEQLNERDEDDSTGALARVNPWLSACDLAQPNTAPDLQGQCSAGTLPRAWVNEGPGPPQCPEGCATMRLNEQRNKNIIKKYANNKMDYNNIINITNINNKNINTFNSMMTENRNNNEKQQQCLDYFGDNEESSPAQICKLSTRAIAVKLRALRLRHCCERNAISGLHGHALDIVYQGGSKCVQKLTDLLDTDALASRITCELNEILIRYDCRQPYSIKHGCNDCKEAYRRWVCSTLIPYFAEPNDIRQDVINASKINSAATSPSSDNHTKPNQNNNKKNFNMNNHFVELETSNLAPYRSNNENDLINSRQLKRSRRKSEVIRKKIRPCLSVCQTVEENCPYMLPGDRAPAHPTQYAGEPTFLCLDPNIPETGDQLEKSNNGPDNCCYRYCGSVYDGLCAHCTSSHSTDSTDTNTTVISKKPNDESDSLVKPLTCTPMPLNTATFHTRCPIPFYASSSTSNLRFSYQSSIIVIAIITLTMSITNYLPNVVSHFLRLLMATRQLDRFIYFLWTISWLGLLYILLSKLLFLLLPLIMIAPIFKVIHSLHLKETTSL